MPLFYVKILQNVFVFNMKSKQNNLLILSTIAIITLSIGSHLQWWNLYFYAGPYLVHHWLGWIGALYIAVITPIYHLLKRRYPKYMKTLLTIHMFGNIAAFSLISTHFTQVITMSVFLGTGLALYVIVAIMVVTGLMQRLQLLPSFRKSWRFIHVSLSLSYYIVLSIHILRNVGII